MKSRPQKTRWFWFFGLGIALILFYKLCDILPTNTLGWIVNILSPFLAGFGLAFLLHGPANLIEKLIKKLKGKFWQKAARPISLVIVYALLVGILTLMASLIIPGLVSSITDLAGALPSYIVQARERLTELTKEGGWLANLGLVERVDDLYNNLLSTVTAQLTPESIFSTLKGVVNLTGSLINIVLTVIVSVYMLSGREALRRNAKSLLGLRLSPRRVQTLADYSHRVANIFYSYFYGTLLDSLVVGVVLSAGFLVFRVPYAVLLGMGVGLLNMIPYFGAFFGGVAAAFITLLSRNIYTALGVAIYIVVVQQLDGNILQPRIVGNSVGLKPFYVLLAITVFGGLFGFWGILLGTPVMAVIQMLVRDALAKKREAEAVGEKPAAELSAEETPPKEE